MDEKSNKASVKHLALSAVARAAQDNPWTEAAQFTRKAYGFKEFNAAIDLCKFFYKTEPMVSTTINKLVEIGINKIVFTKNGLSDNEFRVFESLQNKLLEFASAMATEYLLSGLVVPEVSFGPVDKEYLMTLGVKKYSSLVMPDSLWVRNPKTITIYSSVMSDKPSYYVKIPQDTIDFIKSGGKYPDGKEDLVLFELLKKYYPDFVKAVMAGETELLLDSKYIMRRKYLSDNPYPIPYIYASLEALQHKRKLRRMDYSIIDKVISSIMHVKVGSDEFPITDSPEDEEFVESILTQLRMRETTQETLERIFQLVTNHTVNIEWITPNTEPLLDDQKYIDINQEILFGLGFPRVLISGETQRSGTSDPELAMLSPVQTMHNFRHKISEVLVDVCREVSEQNGFTNVPGVYFKSINMHSFADYLEGLNSLYNISAISRTSMGEVFGYDFEAEASKLATENELLRSYGLPEFGPQPFSREPSNTGGNSPEEKTNGEKKPEKKPTKKEKPIEPEE
jgi:hypothetical protein